MARYLGGLITKDESQVLPSDNFQDTSAPGVWTLEEALTLTKANRWPTAGFTSFRGLFGGGGSNSNVIDFVTISSEGNATDFGDLSVGR